MRAVLAGAVVVLLSAASAHARLYSESAGSSEYYSSQPAANLRVTIANLSLATDEAALSAGCHNQARFAFLRVVEDFPNPSDAALRERARIGLDDIRHRQLLDVLERRR